MDALPGKSRDRVRQRTAGLQFLSQPIHAAVERNALPGSVVSLPGWTCAFYFAFGRRCDLPGQRRVRRRPAGAATRTEYRQRADPAGLLTLCPWLHPGRADALV